MREHSRLSLQTKMAMCSSTRRLQSTSSKNLIQHSLKHLNSLKFLGVCAWASFEGKNDQRKESFRTRLSDSLETPTFPKLAS